MRDPHSWLEDPRRAAPRVDVDSFCWEVVDGIERHGAVVDLSPEGARLVRPYRGGPTPKEIQLELEVPEIDEVVWAKAHVCFDQVSQGPRPRNGGLAPLIRTTGIRLASAATRDLRLLRDYVMELRRARQLAEEACGNLLDAACYARG